MSDDHGAWTPRRGYLRRATGLPALYVRHEVRPGREEPEALFLTVDGATVMQRWTEDPGAEFEPLAADPGIEKERDALLAALRSAPADVAPKLRGVYREALAA